MQCFGRNVRSIWMSALLYMSADMNAVTYMAKAISVHDLVEQVAKRCPEGTAIPSEQWVRLQFWPKNPWKAAFQYTKQLPVKMMVQKHQFRKNHMDSHYCAAILRYVREYAVLFRDSSLFLCLDDKHRIKVGEPGTPVAAAERGKQVLVHIPEFSGMWSQLHKVQPHTNCAFKSWHSGINGLFLVWQVFVGIKVAVFEPSSALRHASEVHLIMNSIWLKKRQYTLSWCHSTQRWHDSIWNVGKLSASANSG